MRWICFVAATRSANSGNATIAARTASAAIAHTSDTR
jgi:hypothetical protein